MNEPRAATSSLRIERFVEVVDRAFPLLWIGFYLLLPVSGWASVMFDSWYDQQRDLEALRSVLADGRAGAIADNVIGPAYIATAAFFHHVFGLSPEDSLVLLTRAAYALSVAGGVVLVGVLVRRLTSAPPLVSLAAQFVFAALVFSAGTWQWSDVPWSHFFAAFLAVTFYAIRFAPPHFTVAHAGATGVVLALLALTRTFELVAVVAAWGSALVVLTILQILGPRLMRTAHLLYGTGAFFATTAVVYLVTGKRDLFFLYGNRLDRQSGDVLIAEIAKTPTFSLGLVPVKLVQLFVDPCYYSMCELSDYMAGEGSNIDLWSLPLAIQLPALVLLPLCLFAVGTLVAWSTRNRVAMSSRARELRLLVEMTLAAAAIVLGYTASTLSGSSHLRYGFARDFLLPALLAGVVAVSLVAAGLWLVISRMSRGARVSPEFGFVILAVVASAGLVAGVSFARAHGLPRIESRQLGRVVYTASCRGDVCDVSIDVKTRSGRSISIPEASTLTFGCGSDDPSFTVYVKEPTAGVHLMRPCRDPRLVAAWPVVMGLPPGSYALRAVRVENVRRGD